MKNDKLRMMFIKSPFYLTLSTDYGPSKENALIILSSPANPRDSVREVSRHC